jgi:hypothetical protein
MTDAADAFNGSLKRMRLKKSRALQPDGNLRA